MAETAVVQENHALEAPESAINTGVLPCQVLREMIGGTSEYGKIRTVREEAPIEDDQIQPASIDLRLGDVAYPVDTSFLPGRGVKVLQKMRQLDERSEHLKLDLTKGNVLVRGQVYVIPLQEKVALRSEVEAVANPKSSTGRLDILTRLIADEGTAFDQLDAGYNKGELYVEVVPRSFSVVVKAGDRLNQLRFRRTYRGNRPRDIETREWKNLVDTGQIVRTQDEEVKRRLTERVGFVPFTVDLKGSQKEGEIIGWKARKHAPRIDLARRDYNPLEFWDPLRYSADRPAHLTLYPEDFFILMTREEVGVPQHLAAEMLPYDTRAGEFRVHYAGFFDPGFGWNADSGKTPGSRGVLEVRSHEVPFLLEHGQTVGWLRYERMVTRPERLYGQDVVSNYQGQALKLAKQFKAL